MGAAYAETMLDRVGAAGFELCPHDRSRGPDGAAELHLDGPDLDGDLALPGPHGSDPGFIVELAQGLDDLQNDDDVTVQIFASEDSPALGTDNSVLTGATPIFKDLGIDLESVKLTDLGRIKKVKISSDDTVMVGGGASDENLVREAWRLHTSRRARA